MDSDSNDNVENHCIFRNAVKGTTCSIVFLNIGAMPHYHYFGLKAFILNFIRNSYIFCSHDLVCFLHLDVLSCRVIIGHDNWLNLFDQITIFPDFRRLASCLQRCA